MTFFVLQRIELFNRVWEHDGNDSANLLEKENMMKVLFVVGFGPIVSDMRKSAAFYRESLGISLQEEADGYLHTEDLQGARTFALWPLSQVAQSCFGVNSKLGEISTDFEVKLTKSARRVEIRY